jgi:TP901 family phage tail tape measure protein
VATSFDATARINLDISSFAQGASAVTRSGGQMSQIFQNLSQVLGKVQLVEGNLAAKLRSSLQVYNQIASTAKNYATAVAALQKNETAGADGAQHMTNAFNQLRTALSQVQGMSEKEYQRLNRTVQLYERLANVIHQLSSAQKNMSTVTQNAITAEQKEEQQQRKAAETAQRLAQEEQKLALRRENLVQSGQRIAQEEQRIALSRQRLAQVSEQAASSQLHLSSSSFALRNTLGELEGSFQQLFNVVSKIPTAFASAAISQEAAFAQVARVVGESEAASAGLLQQFQKIAQAAPISFEEVAKIGQLGGQIGISASALGDFTDTIVKFSLTTGVASEEATLLLGRIAQMQDVPISEMEQLASTILHLGTVSAATEDEILQINASIATVSNLFGLTTQETAGLSAALATLQVRPELSRGALTRVFNELSTSVADGGTELRKLAKVMDLTSEETAKLLHQDPGAFFLKFIEGLSRAAGSGGEVQGVLRELGVNAVRDIDVFSRLANNTDVVRKAFDDANVEFARGTELQRQSQGIYNTTAAQIQNLGDAFQTLLADMGGPLANAIGFVAKELDNTIKGIVKLGPIVPIFGTLAALALTSGAAWLIYQVGLAKVIQSLIAMKELQKNLGASSLGLKTAIDIYRGSLTAADVAQARMNASLGTLEVSTTELGVALTNSVAGIRAQVAAATSAAAGLDLMSTSQVAAMRSAQGMSAAVAATAGNLTRLDAANIATALSMTNVSNANRAFAITQTQMANSSRVYAGQTAIAATAVRGLNTSTAVAVPALTTMSASMQRAATAGAALGSGIRLTSNVGATAATAFTRVEQGISATAIASKAAAFALGPWGIALATAGVLLGPMVAKMFDFRSEADRIADAAFKATGGTTALANAIKADTDAAAHGVKPYRELSVAKSDMSAADRRTAENAKSTAEAQNRAIELTKGSVSELQRQAAGHGAGAEAAARYLRAIQANNRTIQESTKVLGENNVAIGQNVQQWLADTAQAVVENSKLADGSERSAEAMKQLSESGLDVGSVLKKSLTDPKGALADLDSALKVVGKTASQTHQTISGKGGTGVAFTEDARAAQRLQGFLLALRKVVSSEADTETKSKLTKKLLADALDQTGQSAASASGKIKLTKENLEDLDTDADSAQKAIDDLGQQFEKFGTPLDAFKKAAESAFGKAKDAMDKFSLKSKGGLDAYLKQLDKIAQAQRDWAKNLIKISTTLGPDIAAQFQKLGPEAAPAVAQLANLSASELKKLGPQLAAIGSDATSDLAASIIQNSGKIKNATLQTRTVIADVFGNVIGKAKTSGQFADVSNEYARLIQQLNKLPKGVKIDISANDAKAFKSLNDLSVYIDLVSSKTVSPKVAIDIIKARDNVDKLAKIIRDAEASGKLDAKGKAKLDAILFQAQLAKLSSSVKALSDEGKLDAKGKGKLSDSEYRAKVLALTQFLASQEGSGLLNPKGKAQLNDKNYRAQVEGLAKLILGDKAAGKFDANGDGHLSTGEFLKLLQALKDAVANANRGKLSPKGTVTLANVGGFKSQLGGIVQAAYSAGSRITQALTRSATVSVGYYYYQKNSPPKSYAAANGGWINGPGGPKADVIPAMLSNGEFVVNAASAKRFGALLELINSSGGRGFSGVAQRLFNAGVTGGSTPVRLTQGGGGTTMLGSNAMMSRTPPESVSAATARIAGPQSGPTTVFNINNQYPQAEPTSVTINRSLAYAATINGV